MLLVKNGILVKGKEFRDFRKVGDPARAAKVYNDQLADEIVVVSLGRGPHGLEEGFLALLEKIRESCSMPVTAGGGLRGLQDARSLFERGADKVLLNTAAYQNKNLLSELAGLYGSQSIVCGVDYRTSDGNRQVLTHHASIATKVKLFERIEEVTHQGAGELLIQDVDREGGMSGLDLEVISLVKSISNCPLTVGGGVGSLRDIHEAFTAGADAVACGSVFNFGDNSPIRAEHFMRNLGQAVKQS